MSLKAGVAMLYALRPAAAFSIAACAKKPCACTHMWCDLHLPRRHMTPFSELTCIAGMLRIELLAWIEGALIAAGLSSRTRGAPLPC